MLPFKKIICPLDFSKPSLVALNAAIELSGHFSASLGLVHVIEKFPPPTPDMGFGYYDFAEADMAAEEDAKKQLRDIVKNRVAPHISTFSSVRHGDTATEILSFAEEHTADLIVIATHGLTGWRHLVFGSIAEKVVQNAGCAVLTIHRPDSEHIVKGVTTENEKVEQTAVGS